MIKNGGALSGVAVFYYHQKIVAVEQIDSASVVTLSMHGVGLSNLHQGISLPFDRQS